MKNLHTLTAEDAVRRLEMQSAPARGGNRLFAEKKRTLYDYFLPILSSPLLVLFAITVIAAFVAEEQVLGYVSLGSFALVVYIWYLAYRRTLDKLDGMYAASECFVRVLREGKLLTLPSEDLVIGDILLLQKDDFVPADCRVLSESMLTVSEGAVFSGKGRRVKKTSAPCRDCGYFEADNMLWAGSVLQEGSCRAIVAAIGENTRIASLGEKKPASRQVSGMLAQELSRLSGITSSVLLGMLLLVTVFGLTPLSTGLFRDWLLFVSLAATASVELFVLILTVATSRALFMTRGILIRRREKLEALSKLDAVILSASALRDKAQDGIHTLLIPTEDGVRRESVSDLLSHEGERVLRNAFIAMGGLSHPAAAEAVTYQDKTVSDHVRAAFEKAGLTVRESSFAILHQGRLCGLSLGIFQREENVFATLSGELSSLFPHVGFVYEGENIRPVTADDAVLFAKKGALGVAIATLEANAVGLLESEEALLSYLDRRLVFEGAAIVDYGMAGGEALRDAANASDVSLMIVCENEYELRYLKSLGAKAEPDGSGFVYLDNPSRKSLYQLIRDLRAEGRTVLFEGRSQEELSLMKEADLSLARGDAPKREAICAEDAGAILENGTSCTRLYADLLLSGDALSVISLKKRLSDAFFRTQSAVLYLFTTLSAKLLPAIVSIVTGKDIVTAIFFLLCGFGFDTLAVFAILWRHGDDGATPEPIAAFRKRVFASIGVGTLTGGISLTFALVSERYFSLSAEVFSSVALFAASLVFFWFAYLLIGRSLKPSPSLGTVLTVGGVILLFILLFARGSFGKFGFLFFGITSVLAAGLSLASRLILAKVSKNPSKKAKKVRKIRKNPLDK